MGRLEGHTALITGAAGGLGRALVRGFLCEGARVYLSDVDGAGLESCISELEDEGAAVSGAAADISKPREAQQMVDGAIRALGRISVLVNNAGVSGTRSLWELTEADWDQVLNVNVKGTFFVLQAVARHMAEHGGGSIVNIASVAGRAGRPTLMHYAASKAAVISMTRSAALAVADRGIRVNAIAPGMIDTEMLHRLRTSWNAQPNAPETPEQPAVNKVPLGRVAQPRDLVGTAIYLAGSDSAYVTGQTINVCGGLVLS